MKSTPTPRAAKVVGTPRSANPALNIKFMNTPSENLGASSLVAVGTGSALSETQRESAEWWAEFFARRRFPQRGMFFIVPGDEPGEAVILHAHSGRKMDFRLDRGETWAQSQQVFEAALPHADEVALPTGTNPDKTPLPNVGDQTRI